VQVNPYNIELDKLEANKKTALERIAQLSRQLDWYRGFQPEAAHARRLGIARALSEHAVQEVGHAAQLAGMNERLQHLRAAKRATEEEAKAGLDPRSWLSSERSIAKRKAVELGNQIAQLDIDISTLVQSTSASIKGLHDENDVLQRDLDTYRGFDPLRIQSEVGMRTTELGQMESELAKVRDRKLALDRVIAPLWQRLEACRAQQSSLERDLRKAEAFSEQLAAAQGNRAAIHQACEREFGDGRPGMVKRALKGKLEPVKREIGKLEERIAGEVRKSRLDVREVIIDGSNMAYHGGDFIGLQALEAIVPALATRCAVTINFDPNFRRKIGLSSADVRARFPQASVHFAPHGMKADPFVLKHAEGKPHTYVISNDKFSEFLDKEAVKQGRILKHAIMNNAVQIPDLDISASLPRV